MAQIGEDAQMTTSRFFGELSATSEYAETQIARGGETVRVDVNVATPSALGQDAIDAMDQMIASLDARDAAARAAFTAAMDDEEEEPLKFWRFHHEEVEGYEELSREGFVAALQLKRVGFYPDGAFGTRSFMVLDYLLRGPTTDQLLVAKFLRDGSLLGISWES